MKICGYCGNEYDDKEIKCPVCGSKLLKHTKGAETAAEEYRRIEEEIKNKRKSRSMILGIGIGVIALIIFGTIFSVVNYFNDPQREIDKEAKKLYQVAVQQIKDRDYEEAIETLDNINVLWSEYSKVEGKRIEAVKGQLTNKIEQYEATGDYEAVITYINENLEDVNADSSVKEIYNRAVLEYKREVIAKSKEYLNNNKYDEAISVLTTAIRIIGEDSELENAYIEVVKNTMLDKIQEYKKNNAYGEAIKYMNDNLGEIGNDSEILIELSKCENEYRNQIIAEAQSAYVSGGYESALQIVNKGLTILIDDDALEKEKTAYSECAPVDLTSLEPYYDGGTMCYESNVKDTLGNNYLSAIRGFMGKNAYGTTGKDYFLYDIGGKYNKLTAVAIVWEKDKGDTGTGLIYIYGDGVLLFSKEVTSEMKPFPFDIDITGINELKVELYGQRNMNGMICDVMLQKTR